MEKQYAKHVRIICDLNPGDKVTIDGYSKDLEGRELTVESVHYHPNCQSAFMVKVEEWSRTLDSTWFTKTSK